MKLLETNSNVYSSMTITRDEVSVLLEDMGGVRVYGTLEYYVFPPPDDIGNKGIVRVWYPDRRSNELNVFIRYMDKDTELYEGLTAKLLELGEPDWTRV